MEMIRVRSSVIRAVGYNPSTQRMWITSVPVFLNIVLVSASTV